MTTAAQSGHLTSSLSAVELMVALCFGGVLHYDVKRPRHPGNDHLIFSKGHASPLYYSLWAAAGAIPTEELLTFRSMTSRLEGHPSMRFPYTEAPTGSLGQGLSIGVGMALHAKYITHRPNRTYVLLGDSEMAEGSVWEAIQLAAHYKLNNLVGIIDVNRLGQRGETMYGHRVQAYQRRVAAFGWHTIVVDGHKLPRVVSALKRAARSTTKPVMIIAQTVKGKGIAMLENKNGWHGKALHPEQYEKIQDEIVDPGTVRGQMLAAWRVSKQSTSRKKSYQFPEVSTRMSVREAVGHALAERASQDASVIVLDAEVSNSTKMDIFKRAHPKRFFEMFIAEQNMVGTAVGLGRLGLRPVVSSFAAFLMRAADQIRMSQYAHAPLLYIGSHAGSSIGKDGASQMGLEDIALFRSLRDAVVLCPSDAYSARALVRLGLTHPGVVYIRSTRAETRTRYTRSDTFQIGGSRVRHRSSQDVATIITMGVTIDEAEAAYGELKANGIRVRVIDAYSIKPLDVRTIRRAARETKHLIIVEDHYPDGGLRDAVLQAITGMDVSTDHLCVGREPHSGSPAAVLQYEGIGKRAMIQTVTRKHA